MPCLFAVFEICHRSHSPLCSLFQVPKPTKIQVKIGQLILSPLLNEPIHLQTYPFLSGRLCCACFEGGMSGDFFVRFAELDTRGGLCRHWEKGND